MKINKVVSIVCTEKINEAKEFYTKYFGFKVYFEMENKHLSLCSGDSKEHEISFMAPNGEQQPPYSGAGLTMCLEVNDVDSEYERLSKEDVNIVVPVQDNPWGDRSFIVLDPVGISVYVYSPISPSEEFKQYFKD